VAPKKHRKQIMNTEEEYRGQLDAAVQAELDQDSEFQASIATVSDETEKATLVTAKKNEILAKKAPEFFAKAEDQRKRAEIAEKKPPKPKDGEEPKDVLSTTDLYSLMNAKVAEEDVPEVQKAAKLLGVTIAEALKDDMVIAKLARNVELRASANALNTDPKRPGIKTATDAEILERAKAGEVFKPGSAEAEQLFWAKRGGNKS
jgi:hypothetical protein